MKSYTLNKGYLIFMFSMLGVMTFFGIMALILLPITGSTQEQPPVFLSVLWLLTLAWVWYAYLRIPYKIGLKEDGEIIFRSALKETIITADEISSIKTQPLAPAFLTIKYRGGKIFLIAYITGLHDLITELKSHNPEIVIKGI